MSVVASTSRSSAGASSGPLVELEHDAVATDFGVTSASGGAGVAGSQMGDDLVGADDDLAASLSTGHDVLARQAADLRAIGRACAARDAGYVSSSSVSTWRTRWRTGTFGLVEREQCGTSLRLVAGDPRAGPRRTLRPVDDTIPTGKPMGGGSVPERLSPGRPATSAARRAGVRRWGPGRRRRGMTKGPPPPRGRRRSPSRRIVSASASGSRELGTERSVFGRCPAGRAAARRPGHRRGARRPRCGSDARRSASPRRAHGAACGPAAGSAVPRRRPALLAASSR